MKYLLLAPAIVLCAVFVIWPLAAVAQMSLLETNFVTERFVGLANYARSLGGGPFLRSVLNSFGYMLLLGVGNTLAPLLIALWVSKQGKRWQDAARIVLYVPTLAAGIIIAQTWRWVFHARGPVNWALGLLGLPAVSWFGSGLVAIPTISFIVLTSTLGVNMIVLLASILGIDRAVLDAARVDGASTRQIDRLVVAPILAPTVGLVALLGILQALQLFESIYVLAPYDYAATAAYSIYQHGFQWSQWGMANAEAVLLLALTLGIYLAKQRVEQWARA